MTKITTAPKQKKNAAGHIHTDNSSKSGFSALETLGQVAPGKETYFTYTAFDGSTKSRLIRYPEVTYSTNYFLHEDMPGIFHSSYALNNFYFADRIDEFAVVDPGKKALFVDVGLYDFCGIDFLDGVLQHTNTPWSEAEVFLTHSHDDHDGNALYCLDKGAKQLYIGNLLHFDESMTQNYLDASGLNRFCNQDLAFYVTRLLQRSNQFDGYESSITHVLQGNAISVGPYSFEVLETLGHTVEHTCLLEREKGILFAGDHILETAPGLMTYFKDIHLLKNFLDSLRYIKTLNLNHVFMCHHDALVGSKEINAFIDRILDSYVRPINKMQSMLDTGACLTIYELAKRYYSYLPSFEQQPTILLTRRCAIAFSYLEYLVDVGKAKRRTALDGALEYSAI